MNDACETMQELMSGYLDDELDDEDIKRMKGHLESCAACRQELNEMTLVVSAADTLSVEVPSEEEWDGFLDGVYNRIERKTAWFLIVLAIVMAVGWAVHVFILTPIVSLQVKIMIEVFLVGLALLFSSVMRQRSLQKKTDRYSRDVHK
jgi:predicted anti-sigma-YlaC factor YlaD